MSRFSGGYIEQEEAMLAKMLVCSRENFGDPRVIPTLIFAGRSNNDAVISSGSDLLRLSE
jgi:hypothetical protein